MKYFCAQGNSKSRFRRNDEDAELLAYFLMDNQFEKLEFCGFSSAQFFELIIHLEVYGSRQVIWKFEKQVCEERARCRIFKLLEWGVAAVSFEDQLRRNSFLRLRKNQRFQLLSRSSKPAEMLEIVRSVASYKIFIFWGFARRAKHGRDGLNLSFLLRIAERQSGVKMVS